MNQPKKSVNFGFVLSPAYDMVIVDRVRQEEGKIIQANLNLRAAQHIAVRNIMNHAFLDKVPR